MRLGDSERVDVEVACPLDHLPRDEAEQKEVFKAAYAECRKLIGPVAKILGLAPPHIRIEKHPLTDQDQMIFTFATLTPESVQVATKN